MDRRKTSSLWNFYSAVDSTKAKCNICKHVLSCKTSTSNLKKHLERKHPTISLVQQTTKKENPISQTVSVASTSSAEVVTDAPSTSATVPSNPEVGRKIQCKLPNLNRTIGFQAKTKIKIDKCLMELFFKDFQPFSVVEDKGFQKFVTSLNSSYQLPSRKTIANTLLPAMYEEKQAKIKDVVKNVSSVTVTTDCWTSINVESFMAITIHFIDEEFEAKSILLECSSFEEAHTSANLATELNRVITLWGLESKILLAISDNAANIQKAIKDELKWKHFGCFAHTINLIVQNGLKSVEPIMAIIVKFRSLVAHFKRSTTASSKLFEVQVKAGKEPKKLLQDVTTRWNSTYYMVDRLLEMEEIVRTTMALLNSNVVVISVEEWLLLRELRKVLKPMEELTKIISGQKYVTLSSVLILTKGIEHIYKNLQRDDDDHNPLIQNLIKEFLSGIAERFKDLENSKTLLVSTFLDPRFKNVGFSESVADRAKKLVTNLVANKIQKTMTNDPIESTSSLTVTSTVVNEFSVWGAFDEKAAEVSVQSTIPASSKAIIEIQRYMEETLLGRNEDPLKWWKQYSYNYPYLSKVVLDNFGTVATSVPCERVFSKSGQLISERRSRISATKVKQIMFLNVNADAE